MGLLHKLRERRQTKKVERLVRDKLAQPYPRPSEIADYAATLPRFVKRAHKLEVRCAYRTAAFRGITDSRTRMILAEQVAGRVFAEAERYKQEDEAYNVRSTPPTGEAARS